MHLLGSKNVGAWSVLFQYLEVCPKHVPTFRGDAAWLLGVSNHFIYFYFFYFFILPAYRGIIFRVITIVYWLRNTTDIWDNNISPIPQIQNQSQYAISIFLIRWFKRYHQKHRKYTPIRLFFGSRVRAEWVGTDGMNHTPLTVATTRAPALQVLQGKK